MPHVVTLNAGSSSIKFALFDVSGDEPLALAVGLAETIGDARRLTMRDGGGTVTHEEHWDDSGGFHADALHRILAWRRAAFPDAQVIGAGHRVVHGGLRYEAPVIVDDDSARRRPGRTSSRSPASTPRSTGLILT
jgi:acetate kinase